MTKRIFGETDGVRGKANYFPLDVNTVVNFGRAIAEFTKKTVEPNPNRDYKVIIGKDTRRSGYMVEQALTAGFLSRGVDVMTIGPVPTPALSHLVKSFALDLGVEITASHNPYTDNGIKVFDRFGGKISDKEELAIEEMFTENHFLDIDKIGRAKRIEDVTGRYIEFVKSISGHLSLKGMTIVVDCANGAAYKTAPTVFEELGAKVIKIGIDPNGYNINLNCGALFPEEVKKAVLENKADLGIALDGDADRVIMVDELGHIIDGDYIMALIATSMKEKGQLKKNTLVTTQYSNLAMIEYLNKNDIKVDNSIANGDHAIISLCKKEGYNLGGEQTGHYILFDYIDTGDGTLSSLIVMKYMKQKGMKLSDLAYKFEKYPQKQVAIEVLQKTPLEKIEGLDKLINSWESKFGHEGRVFLRYSGTENKLRIMVESKKKALLENAMAEISEFLRLYFKSKNILKNG